MAVFFVHSADPPGPTAVGMMAAKHIVNLRNQRVREFTEAFLPGRLIEAQKVADCESVRPKITTRNSSQRRNASAAGEAFHDGCSGLNPALSR